MNAALHFPMAILVLEEEEGTSVIYHTLRGNIAPPRVIDALERLSKIAGKVDEKAHWNLFGCGHYCRWFEVVVCCVLQDLLGVQRHSFRIDSPDLFLICYNIPSYARPTVMLSRCATASVKHHALCGRGMPLPIV